MDLLRLKPMTGPAPLHLLHPVTGAPLYDQMPDPAYVGADQPALAEGEPEPCPTVDNLLKPVRVLIHGKDSEVFKRQQALVANKRLAEQAASKGKPAAPKNVDFDALEQEMREAIAACIAGWENLEYDGGKLPYSPTNALRLVTELPWLAEQVDRAIADRANFIRS